MYFRRLISLQGALLIVPVVLFFILAIGFDFFGLYGQDSYAYLAYSHELKALILNGSIPGDFNWPIFDDDGSESYVYEGQTISFASTAGSIGYKNVPKLVSNIIFIFLFFHSQSSI